MNIQACTALEARKVFWWRPYRDFGWGVLVYTPICFGLLLWCNPFVAAVLAAVPALALFLYLESRLIVIECINPLCKKDVNTNTPWECGFKACRNEDVDKYPFIHECEHCHYPPKAYVCHHCGQLIFLTSDRQTEHAARRLTAPKPPPPPPPAPRDPLKEKAARHAEEVHDARHKLTMAMYEKETEVVRNKPSKPLPATPEAQKIIDRVRKDFENGKTRVNLEADLMKEIREEYGHNPDQLSEMEKVVRNAIWREEERGSGGPSTF